MPRGIPNAKINQITNQMEKELDKQIEIVNPVISVEKSTIDATPVSKLGNTTDDLEFTLTSDGKYKIPKPKKHADYLEVVSTKIPYITDPAILAEFQIFWQSDEKPIDIINMGKQGYEPIDCKVMGDGYENAVVTHGGYRVDGSAYYHYPFRIRHSDFKEIQRMKQNAINAHEREIQINPSNALDGGGNLYATEQMKLGVTSHSPKYS